MTYLIPREVIKGKIYLIRGHKVMLAMDLAKLYGVPTKRLNEQVKRNIKRFPDDFMIQLSDPEYEILKSQIATSSWGGVRNRFCTVCEIEMHCVPEFKIKAVPGTQYPRGARLTRLRARLASRAKRGIPHL